MDKNFSSIDRLPPYVFEEIGQLKMAARRRGEDIIDFGMGNPDGATPDFIVDKLKEVVMRPDTHRYSQSKGIPKLRQAITDWYARKFDVVLDPEEEAIATLGSKEGLSNFSPKSSLSNSSFWFRNCWSGYPSCANWTGYRLF
jgi:alanine-synthesizing transaminase